ncbi:MAG: hypothetical protein JNG90_00700 [Planctomycetaceae bacterium]|nr:hypothetical protein [Planctomycetaceae bacterium]
MVHPMDAYDAAMSAYEPQRERVGKMLQQLAETAKKLSHAWGDRSIQVEKDAVTALVGHGNQRPRQPIDLSGLVTADDIKSEVGRYLELLGAAIAAFEALPDSLQARVVRPQH